MTFGKLYLKGGIDDLLEAVPEGIDDLQEAVREGLDDLSGICT
jgi:hypothetical protein